MRWSIVWIILLIWFLADCALMFFLGGHSTAFFGFTYVFLFSGIVYVFRSRIRSFLKRLPGNAALKFFGLAILVSATEEIYCYLTGNRIAVPVLWADVLFCSTVWLAWYGTWYFFLSKHYRFDEKEALLTAGLIGLLYEQLGNGAIFTNPAGVLIFAPMVIVVYSALFLLPMQLLEFTGTKESLWKYPLGMILPYLLSLPITIVIYLLFILLNVPLK